MKKKRSKSKKKIYGKKKSGCGKFLVLFLLLCLFVFIVAQLFSDKEEAYPRPYSSAVGFYCAKYDVDSDLVYAVMKQESDFSPDVVSEKGATGLMQLMPDTAAWAGEQMGISYDADKLTKPTYNLRIAIWYLNYLQGVFDKDTVKVIAAYNGGENSVKRWIEEGIWDGSLKNADAIPFAETAGYVEAVWKNYEKYQEIY